MSKTYDGGNNWIPLEGNGLSIAEIHGFASWGNNELIIAGAMHNAFHVVGDGYRHLFHGANFQADGAYGISQPGEESICYMNSNYGFGVKNKLMENLSQKNLGLLPLSSKFSITSTEPYNVYFGSAGLVRKYSNTNNSISTVHSFSTTDYPAVVKVVPSNPDQIYVAFDNPCWHCQTANSNVTDEFWVKKNGQWEDISANIRASQTRIISI